MAFKFSDSVILTQALLTLYGRTHWQQVLRRMAIETGALVDTTTTAGASPVSTGAASTTKSSSEEDKSDGAVKRATPLSTSQVELAVAMVQVLSDGQ
jgi:hypothetical protein